MGAHIPIHGGTETWLLASRTRRVCAWCGSAERADDSSPGTTTHGLCRRCLEERIPSADPEAEQQTGPEPESEDPKKGCD